MTKLRAVWRRRGGLWARALMLLVTWAGVTGILIAVGVGVTHSSSVNAFDRHVTSIVVAHRSPALNAVMKTVTWLGSWVALVATGILLVVLAIRGRLPLVAVVLAVVAWVGESAGVTLAKHVVQRSRPPQDLRLVSAHGWSFPSGHTAVAVVIFSTLALVVTAIVPGALYRAVAWVLGVLAVGAVAFSRVELGVHWTTDVIASTVFVTAWLVLLSTLFIRDVRPKFGARGRSEAAQPGDPAQSAQSP